MDRPMRGAISYELVDNKLGRNKARIVRHEGDIYIETEGNHDGVIVCTTVRVTRAHFVEALRFIGGLL